MQLTISIIYTFINFALALLILLKSSKNALSQFYAFCVGCLIIFGFASYNLPLTEDATIRNILNSIVIFLYSLIPFFFFHFMVIFVKRYDILKSKFIVFAIYTVGIFCYFTVLIGLIPTPINHTGEILKRGYIFYITWMSIFFSIGIAMMYSLIEGFKERDMRSKMLFVGFTLLLLILPGPFIESVLTKIFQQDVELYFFSSTLALIIVVYLVFRHKIIVNTPYDTLKSALAVINDIIFKMDHDFRIELVKGAYAHQLGYSENELLGKSFLNFVEQKEYLELYKDFVKRGKMKEAFFDADILNKESINVPMNFSLTPVFTNEVVNGFVAVARNISVQKQSQLIQDIVYQISKMMDTKISLTEFFSKIHQVLEGIIPAPIFCIALYDDIYQKLKISYYNDNSKKSQVPILTGKSLIEYVFIIGRSLLCTRSICKELKQKGIIEDQDVNFSDWLGVPLIGNKRVIGVIALENRERDDAFGDAEQKLLEFISSQIAAMIDRKRAEDYIQKQAALIDIAPNAFVVVDTNGKFIFWSKGAEKLYGWMNSEVIGRNVYDIFFKGNKSKFIDAKDRVLNKGSWHKELSLENKRKEKIIVENLWTLINMNGDSEKTILMVNTDITEKKKLEVQFLRAQRLESIGTLASGVAHDLNNVLAPILTAIQSLRKKNVDKKDQFLLDTLESCTKRGASIVNQVLMFARGSQGESVTMRPEDLLQDIIKIVRETFPKSIKIVTDIKKELFLIQGDTTQLQQILMNLCVNARDAMPNGGSLYINVENFEVDENFARLHIDAKPGPYVLLSVTDTGIGIPAENLEKIFDPFYTTKLPGQGTGLGLSTVLSIIRGHDGFITVYSELETGTKFKIYLPAVVSKMIGMKTTEKPQLETAEGNLILLVEDEVSIRDISKDVLESYGYKVITAGDGKEGLSIYKQYKDKIDVIVTDLEMPTMNGYKFIDELRKVDNDIKIVVSSGLITEDRVEKIKKNNVKWFLPKPYTAEKLIMTVQDILNKTIV